MLIKLIAVVWENIRQTSLLKEKIKANSKIIVQTVCCKHPSHFTGWLPDSPSICCCVRCNEQFISNISGVLIFMFNPWVRRFRSSGKTVGLFTTSLTLWLLFLALSDFVVVTLSGCRIFFGEWMTNSNDCQNYKNEAQATIKRFELWSTL